MEGNIMVERSIYNKARRVKAWFNIKNMDNAITLVQYYPDMIMRISTHYLNSMTHGILMIVLTKSCVRIRDLRKSQSAIRKIFHND